MPSEAIVVPADAIVQAVNGNFTCHLTKSFVPSIVSGTNVKHRPSR
jgi:hypothetical protein